MKQSILIKNGILLTMDQNSSIVRGNLFISAGLIRSIGNEAPAADIVIDAGGCAVLPGFVQTHIHLCQTLFRGSADDLLLIDWLKQRVWPMEAAHSEASIRASARLGIAELIKSGTTCALTMETVNHTDEVFRVIENTGFRATAGKCMMDKGAQLPAALLEETRASIEESVELLERWHNKAEGRIRYCFAPRFAVSCTGELLAEVSRLSRERAVMIHTHASENRTECELVQDETGMRNIQYLHSLGLTGSDVVLAHCVHLSEAELEILSSTKTNVSHCPSSNLKLGSGIAPVKAMIDRGVPVSLGADGAACNNRLDMFREMRTAALLQKVSCGPEAITANQALRMATIEGAKALGLENEIGSLEVGKRADISIMQLDSLHNAPIMRDPASTIVYAAEASDVRTVLIEGEFVMRDRTLSTIDEDTVKDEASKEANALLDRAGISSDV
jgi:5-methylthioadenosine/S-adenosylhomocysteine deaminase